MKWLEIVEIRTVNTNRSLLEKQIINLVNQIKSENEPHSVRIYKNGLVGTDFSVHLLHDSEISDLRISDLGEQIISALKEFGLVHHSLWIEKK